jgi:hypothetical protein
MYKIVTVTFKKFGLDLNFKGMGLKKETPNFFEWLLAK